MKKFFPMVFVSVILAAMLVSQMLINGQELSASQLEGNKERYSVYENQFKKFRARDSKGELVNLNKVSQSIVIINFWASWCTPCIAEFKSLNKLIEKYGDKVYVIGINTDEDKPTKTIRKVEDEYSLKFSSVQDPNHDYASKFNITKIPSSIVYYKGKVLDFIDSEHDFSSDKFIKFLQKKASL